MHASNRSSRSVFLPKGKLGTVALLVFAASISSQAWAQAASAPANAQVGVLGTLPLLQSQRVTVEGLLRRDAEAAELLAKKVADDAAATASAAAQAREASLAALSNARNSPMLPPRRPIVVSVEATPESPEVMTIEGIYGTFSTESDRRVVEVIFNGRSATMRPGSVFGNYRLLSITGSCAIFAKDSATAKTRQICLDELPAIANDNSISVRGSGGIPMPSPVYRPPGAAGLAPGQPMYPQAGTVSTGVPAAGQINGQMGGQQRPR